MNDNSWAEGCGVCTHGILNQPPLTGVVEFYLERVAQWKEGELEFCTCRAGQCYEVSLKNREQKLFEDARRDKGMATFAERGTHPDIESARFLIRQEREKNYQQPTIHS